MRVLLINELYVQGGAELQTLREIELLRAHDHEVWHLTFDQSLGYKKDPNDKYHINIVPREKKNALTRLEESCYKWFFADKRLLAVLQRLYRKINPDIIHINVVNYKAITIYKSVDRIPCVQTIRDLGAICPNNLGIKPDCSACKGYMFSNCIKACLPKGDFKGALRHALSIYRLRRINQIRKKNIGHFLCPSHFLSDMSTNNGLPTKCVNNPFDFGLVSDFSKRISKEKRVYLVYGLIAPHKGIRQVIDAFLTFSNNKNVELHIIGKVQEDFRTEFDMLIKSSRIKYLGSMENKEIIKYLEKVYCVIVPSLWLENYPNTALEGVATKCLVIGSNRGGIPEIINNKELLFDIQNKKSVVDTLKYTDSLDNELYEKLINENFHRICKENSFDLYYKRIMNAFEKQIIQSKSKKCEVIRKNGCYQ